MALNTYVLLNSTAITHSTRLNQTDKAQTKQQSIKLFINGKYI